MASTLFSNTDYILQLLKAHSGLNKIKALEKY